MNPRLNVTQKTYYALGVLASVLNLAGGALYLAGIYAALLFNIASFPVSYTHLPRNTGPRPAWNGTRLVFRAFFQASWASASGAGRLSRPVV